MKIGFDLGDSLSRHEWLCGMAQNVHFIGPHEVHIITLIEDGEQQQVVDRLAHLLVPYTKIHYCLATAAMGIEERAQLKVKVMKKEGIEILFDDVPAIVEAVNDSGMVGVMV